MFAWTVVGVPGQVDTIDEATTGLTPSTMSLFNRINSRTASLLTLAVLALFVAIQYLPLLVRSSYHESFFYNEGWNAYYASLVSSGERIYSARPEFMLAGYPPLSFVLVGMLSSMLGGPLYAGRLVAMLGLIGIAVFAGLIVFVISKRDWYAAAVTSLMVLLAYGTYGRIYVALDDPQMIAHAVVLMGALVYFRTAEDWRGIVAGACIVTLGLFMKHSLVDLPLGIAVGLLFTNRKHFAIWSGTGLLSAVVLGLWSIAWGGAYLIAHLTAPHPVILSKAVTDSLIFVRIFQIPVLVTFVWICSRVREPKYWALMLAVVIGMVYSFFVMGAPGAAVNTFFDVMVLLCICCGLALHDASNAIRRYVPPLRIVLPFLPLALVAGIGITEDAARDLYKLKADRERYGQEQVQFADDAQYVASFQGPAICETLLLCFDARKPFVYEPFNANERITRDPAVRARFLSQLASGYYTIIQLDLNPGETLIGPEPRMRFSSVIMEQLLAHYKVGRNTGKRIFFLPKQMDGLPSKATLKKQLQSPG